MKTFQFLRSLLSRNDSPSAERNDKSVRRNPGLAFETLETRSLLTCVAIAAPHAPAPSAALANVAPALLPTQSAVWTLVLPSTALDSFVG